MDLVPQAGQSNFRQDLQLGRRDPAMDERQDGDQHEGKAQPDSTSEMRSLKRQLSSRESSGLIKKF